MRHVRHGYSGLSTLVGLNIDRVLTGSAIAGTMLLAAWLQSL